ncbi:MAG: ureidoglycolate lyase [Litoreibacter sp.]
MQRIQAKPLTPAGFSRFGDVLDCTGAPDKLINAGLCGRYHDRAQIDVSDGRAGISLFHADARSLPYELTLLERHPDGSQAFIPMSYQPFLILTAEGQGAHPGQVHAFISAAGQAINFHRGTWHGVLTPLHAPGLFAVVDRIGEGPNLEEYTLPEPILITQ